MNRTLKTTVAAGLVVALGAATLPAAANAGGYYHGRYYGGPRYNPGAAAAAGIIGFAAGAALGSALSAPRYYAPAPAPYYAPPAPVTYAKPQPWTPGWYSYCSAKYRSFNPQTGYFLGYDGQYHFCR